MADNSSTFIKLGLFGAALYVAYSQGWLSFLGFGTAAAVPATGTPATGASANSPVAVVPVASNPVTPVNTPSSLDALYTKMVAAATAAGTNVNGRRWLGLLPE